ncbi:uncharacterized protein EV420DRAFT_1169055 [Desarmillaria tabescens]|uniref:Uncharacterized protein n=1 Tax=Armillaria tabescens TaxID=1929756 RepID=A0AA39JCB6_ARMTA|nr:uncharacterized protein EV420DRAFT_1169055 [Desarmillaria tabescens]KAK0439724.1 hypothetical protein EV420DRAFT_1169055 [Desarmillaria tabescens]
MNCAMSTFDLISSVPYLLPTLPCASSSPCASTSMTAKQIFSPDDSTLQCMCELPHDDGFRFTIQELSAGDEIVLGWEWDDAHPIHGGEEGKVEAVDALEGAFMTCACDGRMGCALEVMHRGDWKAGNLDPLVGKQSKGERWRQDCTRKRKAQAKGSEEVLPVEKRTEQGVPPRMRKGQA